MTVNRVYMSWAARALEAYGLTDAALAYLGHNENLTFRVADARNGSAYLLRLHRPVSAAFVGMRQRPNVIASECAWLEALARDTPLAVQAPVRSLSGESVSHVASDDDSIPASLLRWLDGQPFRRDAPDAEAHARALGTLVARLHDHAAHWTPPEGFTRPTYDVAYYRDQLSHLPDFAAHGIVSLEELDTLQRTADAILAAVESLVVSSASWGLIHADLHAGNLLLHNDELRAIDFSLCGIGFFAFDLATALLALAPQHHTTALATYAALRSLPPDTDTGRVLDACALLSRLGAYVYMLPNAAQRDWLRERVPRFVASECLPFLRGSPYRFMPT